MKNVGDFKEICKGYLQFREKYALGDHAIMRYLSDYGQQPQIMVVACCDSRVDPALILQCDPGELFVVRNVANIVPPYEKDEAHHGTSAALEFGIEGLQVKDLILLGHSQCGGIQALLSNQTAADNDFISNWVSLVETPATTNTNEDDYAKIALKESYKHCLTFPWLKARLDQKQLRIHLWFFDIKTGTISTYSEDEKAYVPLDCNA